MAGEDFHSWRENGEGMCIKSSCNIFLGCCIFRFYKSGYFLCVHRLQDQSSASEDEHIHQDTSTRRRACLRGNRSEGRCERREARDSKRCGALLSNPCFAQGWLSEWRTMRPCASARADHNPGESSVPRRGSRRRSEGRHYQAHSATNSHIHCDAIPGQGPRVRGYRST